RPIAGKAPGGQERLFGYRGLAPFPFAGFRLFVQGLGPSRRKLWPQIAIKGARGTFGTMDYICFMAKIKNIDTLTVDSSVLCCNFVNTVSSWKVAGSYDYLDSYDSFLQWCQKL